MLYDIDGNSISPIYNVDGDVVSAAYDIDGNRIQTDESIKVMTYNVQYFSGINGQTAMQSVIIDANNADVIGIQELRNYTPSTMPAVGQTMFADYAYKHFSNHNNKIGMASKLVLSNIVIADFENQDPHDASEYNETRAYMMADISIGGKNVTWINTHLCLTSEYKYLQMAEIFNLAEGCEHVIITGDFNSYTYDSVTDTEYTSMYGMFEEAGYKMANHQSDGSYTKTWTSLTEASSLSDFAQPTDDIIVSANIDILSVSFDVTKLNYLNGSQIDHIPIVVTLKVN